MFTCLFAISFSLRRLLGVMKILRNQAKMCKCVHGLWFIKCKLNTAMKLTKYNLCYNSTRDLINTGSLSEGTRYYDM